MIVNIGYYIAVERNRENKKIDRNEKTFDSLGEIIYFSRTIGIFLMVVRKDTYDNEIMSKICYKLKW